PTSDYQGLLSEEPHDAETTDPPAPAKPPIEEPPGESSGPTQPAWRRRKGAANAGAGVGSWCTRRSAVSGREGIAEPPPVLASLAGRTCRGEAGACAGASHSRGGLPRADNPGGV